jgi:thioredoxin reductase (NADPH)
MACAIQLKRMGLEPVVIEKNRPGGMLLNANRIENYPGFPGGIPGMELSELVVRQYDLFNIETILDEILSISYVDDYFLLKGASTAYQTQKLVIASGTRPVIPQMIKPEWLDSGLIHFDISELLRMQRKTIGIIGAGDAAFDYALSMAEKGNSVIIFNRGNEIKALKVLVENVFINNNIKYFENTLLKRLEILSDKGLKAILNSASGNSIYSLDYLIFATGRIPEDEFFRESLKRNTPNLLKERRLYLIGDLVNDNFRQVSIAVGQGIRTAMDIFHNESNQ